MTAIICLGWSVSWYMQHNDVWGIAYYAQKMTFEDLPSLYNKFYPLGYALFLKSVPINQIELSCYILNALFVTLIVLQISRILLPAVTKRWAVILAALSYFLLPLHFKYAVTPSPDGPASAFIAIAATLIFKWNFFDDDKGRFWRAGVTGLAFGGAALFRYHTQSVFAITLLFFLLTKRRRSVAIIAPMIGGFMIATLPQSIVSMLAGQMPFQSDFKIMVYRVIHGLNFLDHPTELNLSLFEILTRNPGKTVIIWLQGLPGILIYALPAILLRSVTKEARYARFCKFSAFVILLYAVPLALGGSERSPLAISIFCAAPLGGLLIWLRQLYKGRMFSAKALAMSTAMVLLVSIVLFIDVNRMRSLQLGLKLSRNIFDFLSESAGQNSLRESFTDDLFLYYPGHPPYTPRNPGGWAAYGLRGYEKEFPRIPLDSYSIFREEALRQGIKYLILSPLSRTFTRYFFELYVTGFISGHTGKQPVLMKEIGPYKIFSLVP
ncbi:MAG: glycosyltransferase family 39 protein [Spirochaetes bacterium]|nr:glycosyltransferase family 39 protein [Spirochaetota bacterium]